MVGGSAKAVEPMTIADVEAERAVIGACLIDPQAVFGALAERLTSAHFTDPANRAVFDAAQEVAKLGAHVDIVTVADVLRGRKQMEVVGGPGELAGFLEVVATSANVAFHAKRVRDRANLAALTNTMRRLVKGAASAQDPSAFIQEAQRQILSLGDIGSSAPVESAREWVPAYYDSREAILNRKATPGVETGLHCFDRDGGLPRDGMIVVAGRPSMGKTAFALTVAGNVASRGGHVHITSIEMSRDQVAGRLLGGYGEIDTYKLKNPASLMDKDWDAFAKASGSVADWHLDLWCPTGPTMAEIRIQVLRAHSVRPLDLVVVDYLGLIEDPRLRPDQTHHLVTNVSRRMKKLAGEVNAPVMVLAQLNRKVEERANKRPTMADLRDSGAIEQDADIIVFPFRPSHYDSSADDDLAEVSIAKNREGIVGVTKEMRFRAPYQRFED